MVIGVLGGSFCPPTKAHVELALSCIQQGLCDKVIFVPNNDYYPKDSNIDAFHRVNMTKLAISKYPNLSISEHEQNHNENISTLQSLQELQLIYPEAKILFIIGADKLKYRWIRRKEMLANFGYIVSNRDDVDCENLIKNDHVLSQCQDNIKIVKFSSNISSTIVRDEIKKNGQSDKVHENVLTYILDNRLYL